MTLTQALRLVVASLPLLSAVAGYAAPLGPSSPSALVTLVAQTPCAGNTLASRFMLQQPGGSYIPFVIPPGNVLVITGGVLTIADHVSGGTVDGILLTVGSTFPDLRYIHYVQFHPDASGNDVQPFELQNGFAVNASLQVCVGQNTGSGALGGVIHGYLTSDK